MLPKRVTMKTNCPRVSEVVTWPVSTAAGRVATCSEVHMLTKLAIAMIRRSNGSLSSEKFTLEVYPTGMGIPALI